MNEDFNISALVNSVSRGLEGSGFAKLFRLETKEIFNEDFKSTVNGVLIQSIAVQEFCVFVAFLDDSAMRRPIDPIKTFDEIVTGVWFPYKDSIYHFWVNEYEFYADSLFEQCELAVEAVIDYISEHINQLP